MGTDAIVIEPTTKRDQVLAIVIDRIARTGVCPSYEEIGRAMVPQVGKSRAQQLVAQLIRRGDIMREPGARRGIQLRDMARCQDLIGRSAFKRLPYLPLILTGD